MRNFIVLLLILLSYSCKQDKKAELTAQDIVDKAIAVSGGAKYASNRVSFTFRGRQYISEQAKGTKILQRITFSDSVTITDRKENESFKRFFNDSLIQLPDTLANRYSNSVNSVHYFSRLPYGLNDPAVRKTLLGEVTIADNNYYKVKVTFAQENGGEDFEDVYLYWFDTATFSPHYLAYEFHVDGGGIRFRKAYNERFVNGIRFVDYDNYKPKEAQIDFIAIDSLYLAGALELLSKINLEEVTVTPLD